MWWKSVFWPAVKVVLKAAALAALVVTAEYFIDIPQADECVSPKAKAIMKMLSSRRS